MKDEHMNIVIVGHVDHGKSTLIGRLLDDTGSLPEGKVEELKKTCEMLGKDFEYAYIMDSFEEERKENKTIDTTQIHFNFKGREYIIIDAPGHKEFLKNMVSGASHADAAVLITDVKEGVKDQTRRHAYILSLIGIEQVILLVNKMDSIDYDEKSFESVKNELISFMEKLNISPKYIIPISAKMGDNVLNKSESMSWYKGVTFAEALSAFGKKLKGFDFRMPVQDVYEIDGERILVGKTVSGEVRKNDTVTIYPSKRVVKVKEIRVFGESKDSAIAGESIGIILSEYENEDRGVIFCKGKEPIITKELDATIFIMLPEGLKANEEFKLKCATQEIPCRIKEVSERVNSSTLEILEKNAKTLKEAETGKVKIVTSAPIVLEKFNDLQDLGRFVLEKNRNVYAGGVVV